MLLKDRDWSVAELNAGTQAEDFIATDPNGQAYCVEVKNCAQITLTNRRQAMEQAKRRKLPWMLMNKIAGTSSWLVQRQGKRPVIWHNTMEIPPC